MIPLRFTRVLEMVSKLKITWSVPDGEVDGATADIQFGLQLVKTGPGVPLKYIKFPAGHFKRGN